jgi:hypothetical protein
MPRPSAIVTIFSYVVILPSPRASVPTRSGLSAHTSAILE